jgi:hypothetical protein
VIKTIIETFDSLREEIQLEGKQTTRRRNSATQERRLIAHPRWSYSAVARREQFRRMCERHLELGKVTIRTPVAQQVCQRALCWPWQRNFGDSAFRHLQLLIHHAALISLVVEPRLGVQMKQE